MKTTITFQCDSCGDTPDDVVDIDLPLPEDSKLLDDEQVVMIVCQTCIKDNV